MTPFLRLILPAAVALSGALAMAGSAEAACHKPRALTLEQIGIQPKARLAWFAPLREHPRAYRITRNGKVVGQTSRRRFVVSVVPGRAYQFTVVAVRRGGKLASCRGVLTGAAGVDLKAKPGAPNAPAGLAAIGADAAAATLSWHAPRAGAPVGGYRVRANGQPYATTADRSIQMPFLAGAPLKVVVAGVGPKGKLSPPSNVVVLSAGHQPPSPPADLGVVARPSSVVVSWSRAAMGTSKVVGYRIFRDGNFAGQTTVPTVTMKLRKGHKATITVEALDRDGYVSPASAPVVGSVLHSGPSEPKALTLVSTAEQAAAVQWQPSKPSDGIKLTGYRIYRNGSIVGQTAGTTFTLPVVSRRTYQVTVRAVDRVGALSEPAQPVTFDVSHQPPTAPAGVTVSSLSDTSATLTWGESKASNARVVAYRVIRDGVIAGQTTGPKFSMRLSSGRTYRVGVVAFDSLGYQSQPAPIELTTTHELPDMPQNLRVTSVNKTVVTMAWDEAKAHTGTLAGYQIFRSGRPLRRVKATSVTVDLGRSQSADFNVQAVDSYGYGSRLSATLRPESGHLKPHPPTELKLTMTDTTATLSWKPGSARSGATVTGYRILRNGKVVKQLAAVAATLPIASAVEYEFAVQTVDSLGYVSDPVTAVGKSPHGNPSTPGDLRATSVTDAGVALAWGASTPTSGRIVGYRVYRDDGSGPKALATANATSYLAGGLRHSTKYTFSVVAVDGFGSVSPAAKLIVTTPKARQSTGTAWAFLLASTDQSFRDFQAHYTQIGTVVPTYYDCRMRSTGPVRIGVDDPLISNFAKDRGVRLEPRVNCQTTEVLQAILTDTALGDRWITDIVGLVTAHGYDGINIDFEKGTAELRDPLTAWTTRLAARLHAIGKTVSIEVSAKTTDDPRLLAGRPARFYDYIGLAAVTDQVIVMNWGIHWSTSVPGGQDDLPWMKQVEDYTATHAGGHPERFTIISPLYGRDWPTDAQRSPGVANQGIAREFEDVAGCGSAGKPACASLAYIRQTFSSTLTNGYSDYCKCPMFTYVDGGVSRVVYYQDAASLAVRFDLARSYGFNFGVWRLGSEDQAIWRLPHLDGS